VLVCHLNCVQYYYYCCSIYYYFCSTQLFVFVPFCSIFVHLIIWFDSKFNVHCLLEKYLYLILDCIPGISIPSSIITVSPSAKIATWRYSIDFVYPVMSMVVIGPLLPILRQRWWSLLYDVYWLDLMMVIVNRYGYFAYNGIEISEHGSGSEIAEELIK
jgi:hypothetical protein